jgi:hypothetical protein
LGNDKYMFGDDKDNKKIMGNHGEDEMTPRDDEKSFFSSNNNWMLRTCQGWWTMPRKHQECQVAQGK